MIVPSYSLYKSMSISFATGLLIFLIKYNTPLEPSSASLYVLLVSSGILYTSRTASLWMGTAATVLILIHAFMDISVTNTIRPLADNYGYILLAIWAATLLLYRIQCSISEQRDEVRTLTTAIKEHNLVSFADTSGIITYTNPAFCKASGYQADEIIGKGYKILKSEEHCEESFTELWTSISGGKTWTGSLKNKKKDGTAYWVRSTIVPYLDKHGKPYKYLSLCTDITDEINNAADIKSARHIADQATKAKSEFIASMSHELRTPLNAIIGFSDFILSEGKGPINNKHYKEYVGHILDSGQHLLALVNDILDVSSSTYASDAYAPVPSSIRELVKGIGKLLEFQAEQKGLTVKLHIDDNVPDIIPLDRTRFKQLANNVIGNAIKFTAKGGTISILIDITENQELRVQVKDTGIGIPNEVLNQLGEPFNSGNPYKKHQESQSAGLGLFISKQIIEAAGGRLHIESKINEGTTVTMMRSLKGLSLEHIAQKGTSSYDMLNCTQNQNNITSNVK